jgi:hypothetical protein
MDVVAKGNEWQIRIAREIYKDNDQMKKRGTERCNRLSQKW